MKILSLLFFISLFLFTSCQQKKAKAHQDAVADMMNKYGDNEKKNTENTPPPTPVKEEIANSGLMGKWETILLTGDNNSNGKLDPQEREQATENYKDYFELKPDGTCLFTIAKISAVYEIVEKDGNRSIEIIVADGSRVKQGRIISLQGDELQLMKFSGGRDIIVYKRV
jgi:hypothetical protein